MWNTRLDKDKLQSSFEGRNINNLGYADDTTLMAESEEEQESLLMKMREGEGKLHHRTRQSAICFIHSFPFLETESLCAPKSAVLIRLIMLN